MIRKSITLCLAITAVAALSAMAATAANAGTLHIGSSPAVVTGHSEKLVLILFPEGFSVVCDTDTLEATVQQPQATQTIHELTLTETHQLCKLFGISATVQMNGCKRTLTGSGQPANTAVFDIVGCTSGKQIQIKTAVCTVDIPEQNGLSHLVASNIGANEVNLQAKVSGTTAVQTGAACPGGNNKHTATASSSGSWILKAFQDAGTDQVTKHGHQYVEHTCGVQIHLIST